MHDVVVQPHLWMAMMVAALVNLCCATLRTLSFFVSELPVILQIDGAARSSDAPGGMRPSTVARGGAWRDRWVTVHARAPSLVAPLQWPPDLCLWQLNTRRDRLTVLAATVTNRAVAFHFAYLGMCAWGIFMLVARPETVPFPFAFLLLDVLHRQRVLKAVLSAVTQNTEALWQTARLGLILLYIYAVLGFAFFRDDYRTCVVCLLPVVRSRTPPHVGC